MNATSSGSGGPAHARPCPSYARRRPAVHGIVPCAIATLLIVLAAPSPATAAPDLWRLGRVEVDLSLNAGGIATAGTKVPTGGGGGSLDFWLTWRTGPRVRLGWRLGLIVGAMKWGQDPYGDDAWVPGLPQLPGYGWKATFLPHSGFVIAIDLAPRIALDLGLGIGNAIVGDRAEAGGALFPPCIVAGVGTTFDLETLDALVIAFAVRLDYIGSWLVRSGGTFAPQAGLQFRF
jgi:hypothetical protein